MSASREKWSSRAARGFLSACLLAALAALSSCGGGSAGTDPPAPEVPISFTGRVLTVGPDGVPMSAPAGVEVRLVEIDATGAPTRQLAGSLTASNGTYTLQAPAGHPPGLTLAVERTEADGSSLRALGLASEIDVSPASEAFTREMIAARQARGGAMPTETLARLARFQRACMLFLGVIDLHARDASDAVAELRDWIADDPASVQAFQALAMTGRLPSSLADVGALYGLSAAAAWETSTPAGTKELTYLRFRNDAREVDFHMPNEAFDSLGLLAPPVATVRLENDGATFVLTRLKTQGGLQGEAIANLIGAVRMAQFGAPVGVTDRLMSKAGKTTGVTFDSDNMEDDFSFTSDRRIAGNETIVVGGHAVRAVRVETMDLFTVALSRGGTMRSETARVSWHVPFVGAVRTQTAITVTGAGAPFQNTVVETLDRALVNGHAWPGRVRVRQATVSWDGETKRFDPIAINPNRTIVYADGGNGTWQTALRLVDIDSGAIRGSVELPIDSAGARSFARLSPDGRKLYAAVSRRPPGTGWLDDLPMEQAEAYGGLVLRFDAGSLNEELRVRVPPHASSHLPGRGYPRARLTELLVSPVDATHFVVASIGAVLFRGAEAAPVMLTDSSAETFYGDRFLITQDDPVSPFGWDGIANELRLYYDPHLFWVPPAEGPYAVAIAADGLHFDSARVLTAPASGVVRWTPHVNDLFTVDRIYLSDYSVALDRSTGAVLAGAPASVAASYFGAKCARRSTRVVCIEGSELVERDFSTLQIVGRRNFNADLAGLASSPSMPNGAFTFGPVNEYEYVAAYGAGFSGASTIHRIKVSR